MIAKFCFWAALIIVLPACTLFSVQPEAIYSRAANKYLYDLQPWSLEGRLALTGKNDSWSADIIWDHRSDAEQIKLSGPLGQGAVVIRLTDALVTVARGDGAVESSDNPEEFINQQLGLFVPLNSLRYWVVGLPEPDQAFEDTGDGFRQSGWRIAYTQMQPVKSLSLPRKISVTNDLVKLKLIIDQWVLNDGKAK